MKLSYSTTGLVAVCLAFASQVNAFAPNAQTLPLQTEYSTTTTSLQMARRKSLRKTINAANNAAGVTPMGGEAPTQKRTNWQPVKGVSSIKDLPQKENTVQVVDTMADSLVNGATNPTGAVSVVKYDDKTYCCSVSCPTCKIPLTKAKVYEPNEETNGVDPRLSCDFCKSTFNVRTGERLENAEKAGLMGGIVKGLFSASDKVPLETYDLGEKNGQVLINLP